MSIIGEYYEDEIVYPLTQELKQAKEYIQDFIDVLTGESATSYYSRGKTIKIEELKKFLSK